MIKKTANGKWRVDFWEDGRGSRRIRRTFPTKLEASRFLLKAQSGNVDHAKRKEKRTLKDIITIWYQAHGRNLKDGANRRRWLNQIANEIGNPRVDLLKASDFIAWRSARLDDGNKPNTVNNALAYLRALFRELERIDEWQYPNPVGKIRRTPILETELTFLNDRQLLDLFEALAKSKNRDAFLCAALAVSTGARWTEAEMITWDRIGAERVNYIHTKNGRSRTVPLTACLSHTLESRRTSDNPSGRVFRSCYAAFRKGVERANLDLPKGQLSHVLRHTFASRFMQNGGNILTLQRILGHSTIQMTMRYSHLAPDHFEVVKTNNPITG